VLRISILTIATLRYRFKGLFFPMYHETFVYFGDFLLYKSEHGSYSLSIAFVDIDGIVRKFQC
jgi:hypothetical protein